MSEQNVALVRAILNSGATDDKETILAGLDEAVPVLFSEDVEFIETPERVDARTFHGHTGSRRRLPASWSSGTSTRGKSRRSRITATRS